MAKTELDELIGAQVIVVCNREINIHNRFITILAE